MRLERTDGQPPQLPAGIRRRRQAERGQDETFVAPSHAMCEVSALPFPLRIRAYGQHAIGGAAFTEKTEAAVEGRRSGGLQDRDVDLPRWTVALEEIDAAVAHRYGVDSAVLRTHGHHAGPAKAVAVASRLANLRGRVIAQHYGIGSSAIGTIHRRLADRSDALEIVESLARQLTKKRTKYKA